MQRKLMKKQRCLILFSENIVASLQVKLRERGRNFCKMNQKENKNKNMWPCLELVKCIFHRENGQERKVFLPLNSE